MIITKIAYEKDTEDNFRTDAEYDVVSLEPLRIGRVAWFSRGKTLFFTERLTKVTKEYLKSRNCKYVIK